MADARRAMTFALVLALVSAALPPARAQATVATRSAPDFTLVDDTGHPFRLSGFRGRPVVLFFGYTHCPDVCPTILANLKRAREDVGVRARDVVVALITVDPRRDRPADLRQFVRVFDPSFVGLTGTNAQLETVYRAYHVKIAQSPGGAGGYLVSHTAFVYYIRRDGRFGGFGTWDDPQSILEEDLRGIALSHR